MQHGVPRKLDGHLDHSWLLYRALLGIVAGLAALIACTSSTWLWSPHTSCGADSPRRRHLGHGSRTVWSG